MMRGRSGFTTPGLSAGFCGTAGLSEGLWSGLPGLGVSGLEGEGAGLAGASGLEGASGCEGAGAGLGASGFLSGLPGLSRSGLCFGLSLPIRRRRVSSAFLTSSIASLYAFQAFPDP